MNRKKLEKRIWGKSIASARNHGLISEEEAKFLLDEYLKEFKAKLIGNLGILRVSLVERLQWVNPLMLLFYEVDNNCRKTTERTNSKAMIALA